MRLFRHLPPLLTLGLLLVATPCSAQTEGAREAMANAMARMMEAMGFLGDGGTGVTPDPFSVPMQAADQARSMMQQVPGGEALQALPGLDGWRSTNLDGVWEGRDGGLLIVQGPRFRLYAPNHAHVDGLIQQRNDRIAMYTPQDDVARPYQFAEQQGRLVLRDANGQVYLYRRLWLDQPLPSPAPDKGTDR